MRLRLPSVVGGVVAIAALATTSPAQLQSSLIPPSGSPPAIREFGSAYDATRDLSVTFGGLRLGFVRNEVYEFDGTTWSVSTVFPRPGPLTRVGLAYDGAGGHLVLFGGATATGVMQQATWTYDGTAWTQQSPATSPGPRSGTAMVYDPTRQVLVLFGGFVSSGADARDTWEWNGATWTQASAAGPMPARGAHRMVFDAARGQCVMFGGFSTPGFSTFGDTWQWNGTTWTAVATTQNPPSRCDQAMVYDPTRGRTFMYGGLASFQQPGNIPVTLGDCWVLTSNGWESKSVPGIPSTRSYPVGTYDLANEGIMLHGGFTNTTNYSSSYAVESLSPADMQSYGAGCVGSNGVPTLAPDSLPWLDDYYQVSVTNVPTTTAGFMILGLSDTSWNSMPIPVDLTGFGLPGCDAWLSADISALFLVQNGVGSWGLNVCNCPFAIGVDYSLQAVVLDAGVTRPLGASMSNALRATIGDW